MPAPCSPSLPRFSRAWLQAALALCAGLAAGLVQAAALQIVDDRGHVVDLPRAPQRIVSLVPSLTETVCALGACERLVGIDRHADWPAAVKTLPRVGGMDDANLERIVALRPDVVLLRPRSRVLNQLESLGIKVVALDARSHADMRRVMEAVARLTGRPGAGEAAWRRIDAHLDAARARMPPGWQGRRVYFEVHGVAAAGESSFIGETLARLGLANIVPAAMGPFPRLNPEFVVRADPYLLIAPASADLRAMAARPGWAGMEAIRRGRSCSFAPTRFDVLMRAGPRLDEAADAVVECLSVLGSAQP
ncbi:MAG: ABC transporter substrate-binding protein [Variovorax sp.]|nr:MAG: ABC transporter substrate-binding protein [Variovorax sp.]